MDSSLAGSSVQAQPGGPNVSSQVNQVNKRQNPSTAQKRSNKRQKVAKAKDGTGDAVLLRDVEALLLAGGQEKENGSAVSEASESHSGQLPEVFTEIKVNVRAISSTGDGLALSQGLDRVYVVPFTLPGDVVTAKVVKHFDKHTLADFVRVVEPSPERDDSLVFCKYFESCSGCQLQMMPYPAQLELKRKTIVKAFASFSKVAPDLLPEIEPIMPSPQIRGYRTKLTPHFDQPRKPVPKEEKKVPEIGFQKKGRRFVLDIEDCPIGTDAVRAGMKERRAYVAENLSTYKRGATILLRESTRRHCHADEEQETTTVPQQTVQEKYCVFNATEKATEYVGDYKFESPAGSFFQNNNSILKNFTDYVRRKLDSPFQYGDGARSPKFLVDTYCGSGLFSITCGTSFEMIIGVDISADSIEFARQNAERNGIKNAKFIAGDAEDIFAHIKFDPGQTSVVIDPPRKGCDESFLRQLMALGPQRIVYISCNVHTLARDIGWILTKSESGKNYKVDCLSGFDFFPQTYHVEGCAVLNRM